MPGDPTQVSLAGGARAYSLLAVYLDSLNNVTAVQNLANPVTVTFNDSNPSAGTFASSAFPSGTYSANGTFTPLAANQTTTITVVQPTGFTVPTGGLASSSINIAVGQ